MSVGGKCPYTSVTHHVFTRSHVRPAFSTCVAHFQAPGEKHEMHRLRTLIRQKLHSADGPYQAAELARANA